MMHKPGSMKTITGEKLSSFAVGSQKKSRFQKAREEKELKLKQEADAAAEVYDSFVASFAAEEDNTKTFIRGGIKGEDPDRSNRGEVYTLDSRPNRGSNPYQSNHPPDSAVPTSKKGGRQIDDLLSEIKNRQEERQSYGDSRDSSPHGSRDERFGGHFPGGDAADAKGSFDSGDPNTTNLYVGNICPSVTEEQLTDLFEEFGTINSVKIMWPRTEEEKTRGRNCGFVSYKCRRDAEDAKNKLNDYEFEGHVMTVGWGKAVKITPLSFAIHSIKQQSSSIQQAHTSLHQPTPPISAPPAAPVIAPPTAPAWVTNLPASVPPPPIPPSMVPSLGPLNSPWPVEPPPIDRPPPPLASPITTPHVAQTTDPPFPAPITPEVPSVNLQAPLMALMTDKDVKIAVTIPTDPRVLALINLTAQFVSADGEVLEMNIKKREESNPDFDFMRVPHAEPGSVLSTDATIALHVYYRWRTYAFCMGDSETNWRMDPFQLVHDGPYWLPPPQGRQSEEQSDRKRRHVHRSDHHTGDDSDEEYSTRSTHRRHRSHRRDRSYSRSRSRSSSPDKDSRSRDASRSVRDRDRSRSPRRPRRHSDRDTRDRDRHSDRERYVGMTGAQIERERNKEKGRQIAPRLTEDQYDEWKTYLSTLSVSRERIKETMGFAVDHAESADDIVVLLRKSILSYGCSSRSGVQASSIPWATIFARLYLISDILLNTGAAIKNVAKYRSLFQKCLPEIFEHLSECFRHQSTGRMTARNIEDRMVALLAVWTNWSIYPPVFTNGLEATFLQTEQDVQQFLRVADSTILDRTPTHSLETLKRQANINGVAVSYLSSGAAGVSGNVNTAEKRTKPVSVDYSEAELECKLDYVTRYALLKESKLVGGSSGGSLDGSRGGLLGTVDYSNTVLGRLNQEEADDIDGILWQPESSATSVMPSLAAIAQEYEDLDGVPLTTSVSYHSKPAGVDYDDCLDGVPIAETMSKVPVVAPLASTVNYDYDDDDLDGIPM